MSWCISVWLVWFSAGASQHFCPLNWDCNPWEKILRQQLTSRIVLKTHPAMPVSCNSSALVESLSSPDSSAATPALWVGVTGRAGLIAVACYFARLASLAGARALLFGLAMHPQFRIRFRLKGFTFTNLCWCLCTDIIGFIESALVAAMSHGLGNFVKGKR